MKTLYLECNMGAAGDMLTAALLELTENPEEIVKKLNHLGLPGAKVRAVPSTKCGIVGTHMEVTIDGEEEHSLDVPAHHHEETSFVSTDGTAATEKDHGHEHDQGDEHVEDHDGHHHHHHHHTSQEDIRRMIDGMELPDEVKQDIRNVYHSIAEAEAHAHRMPVEQIHFHEVGSLDAVMDVTAVCLLMHELNPDRVIASPVCTGFGEVQCAHGILPVPAPATAYILTGIPTYSGNVEGEMCTPTGAALLKYYVNQFMEKPVMTVSKIGYGMGTKDFPQANCIRAYLGETPDTDESVEESTGKGFPIADSDSKDAANDPLHDRIIELRCNIDDMTGEEMGYAAGKLMEAGARDVFTTPIGMKKNRPGILLTVICSPETKEKMVRELFRTTTTIGIRETVCHRYVLRREENVMQTKDGVIHTKTSSGYGVEKNKAEYNDIVEIAEKSGKSFAEVKRELGL